MNAKWLLGLAGCLLACGCYDSKAPLSDPASATVDQRLLGIWRMSKDDRVDYYHVGRAGDKHAPNIVRIIEVRRTKDQLAPVVEYLAFTTTLQDTTYLNVIVDRETIRTFDLKGWKPETIEGYNFVRYKIDGDKLTVWTINSEAKEQAIKSGKVKGLIKSQGEIHITESTENVAKFVAESGDKLFNTDEPIHMERLAGSGK